MAAEWNNLNHHEEVYNAPTWCSKLANIPKSRIKLARLPTPIHRWNVPGTPNEFKIYIKRDDLTGCTLSGNKVRKLEFQMADALNRGCKHVISCGSLHSNHARATAAAAAHVGLQSHLVIFSVQDKIQTVDDLRLTGNLLLSSMFGSKMYITPWKEPIEPEVFGRMQKLAEKIRKDLQEDSYLIPLGGSDSVGLYGYIECYRELISQGLFDNISDIVCACGSGGTAMGLALANYLAGSHVKVHAVCVYADAHKFHTHINSVFREIGVTEVKSEDILHIIEGYVGKGYGVSQQKDREFIHDVSQKTGIVLDPTFTAKTARGLICELQNNPHTFKGNNVLFMYTGGLIDCMASEMVEHMATKKPGNCFIWDDKDENPCNMI